MELVHDELEFLFAWAREEWDPAIISCLRIASNSLTVFPALN